MSKSCKYRLILSITEIWFFVNLGGKKSRLFMI